jgi:hypothetical protein
MDLIDGLVVGVGDLRVEVALAGIIGQASPPPMDTMTSAARTTSL